MLKDIQKAIDKMFKEYGVKTLETTSEHMNDPEIFSSILSSEIFKSIIAEPPAPKPNPNPQTNNRRSNSNSSPAPASPTPPNPVPAGAQ